MLAKLIRKLTGRSVIPEAVQEKWLRGYDHTPDFAALEQHQHHLVFLYDFNPFPIKPLYDEVYTEEPMVMLKHKAEDGDVRPVVLVRPEVPVVGQIGRAEAAVIRGEMVQLTTPEVRELDLRYSNGVHFKRVRTKINIPYFHNDTPMNYVKKAFMYQGVFDFWSFQKFESNSYKLLKTREHNLTYKPNYSFTPDDFLFK